MTDPTRPWRDCWRVRCSDCSPEGRNGPLTVRETCEACAEAVAASHRALGHTVAITAPGPVERSHTTQRLLGRSGW